jgi:enoyl-CoA hydratase
VVTNSEILIERRGTAGIITLNRPAALNAVTRTMVRAIAEALERWRNDDAVTRVIVMAAPGRAFSAGGDLRHIYELGRTGRQSEALEFWREEYLLNAAIKHYPKPYVALIDGIVMGGGVGVSVHGSHRVAGDRFQFAMPEVGIGFFPDVGATWFLPRLPGELGTWCALTGDRLAAADAVAAGVATHRVASARFAELTEALTGAVPVDAMLAAFAEPVPSPSPPAGQGRGGGSGGLGTEVPDIAGPTPDPSPQGGGETKRTPTTPLAEPTPIASRRAVIDRLFAGTSVEAILAALDSETGPDAEFARSTAAAIRTKAPMSLKIALAQMRRGSALSFADCMRTEFRIVSRVAYGEDFYEGIRAVIVDKDNRRRWHPATLAEVTPEMVEGYFAPLAPELGLP